MMCSASGTYSLPSARMKSYWVSTSQKMPRAILLLVQTRGDAAKGISAGGAARVNRNARCRSSQIQRLHALGTIGDGELEAPRHPGTAERHGLQGAAQVRRQLGDRQSPHGGHPHRVEAEAQLGRIEYPAE